MHGGTRGNTAPALRMTRQRRVVLEEVRRFRSHPTAAEVHRLVRKRLPRISLATVYRNLDVLGRCGLVRKLDLCGTRMRFDGDVRDHYHVRCVHCGRIGDVRVKAAGRIEAAPRDAGGYEIVGHRLEFVGICPSCGKKKRVRKSAGKSRS